MTESTITPPILAYAVFVFSLGLTVLHLAEEYKGKLWQYFGAIAGVQVADWVGKLVFTVVLGITLVAAAFGILGIYRSEPLWLRWLSLIGVGFLIGGRVSDWWNSHVSKRRNYRWDRVFLQNPGFLSSWAFLFDAALLICLLGISRESWSEEWPAVVLGLLFGSLLFLVVIPTIAWVGKKFFPKSVHQPWVQKEPIPNWVTR